MWFSDHRWGAAEQGERYMSFLLQNNASVNRSTTMDWIYRVDCCPYKICIIGSRYIGAPLATKLPCVLKLLDDA